MSFEQLITLVGVPAALVLGIIVTGARGLWYYAKPVDKLLGLQEKQIADLTVALKECNQAYRDDVVIRRQAVDNQAQLVAAVRNSLREHHGEADA